MPYTLFKPPKDFRTYLHAKQYTLKELSELTGLSVYALDKWIRRHSIAHKYNTKGRLTTTIAAISGYIPRGKTNMLAVGFDELSPLAKLTARNI